MNLSSDPKRRDIDAAFLVLDGGDAPAPPTPDALALATAARRQWQTARLAPPNIDFDALDRSVLRAVAEERLRTNERRQVTRVLFPGLGLAAALAAIGLVLASNFGEDTRPASGAEVASTVPLPQAIGVGTRLTSGDEPMAASVSVATLTLDPRSGVEVLVDDPLVTRVSLVSGAAHFAVAPRPPGGRFEIEAGQVTVTVVGTGFRVQRLSDSTLGQRVAVTVDHGIVEVRSPDGRTVRLTRGESVTVPAQREQPAAVVVSEANAAQPLGLSPAPEPTRAEAPAVAVAESPVLVALKPPVADEVAVVAALMIQGANHPPPPRAKASRAVSPKAPSSTPAAQAAVSAIVLPEAMPGQRRPTVADQPSKSTDGAIEMIVETSEDDRLATADLRDLVAGLGPATCSARLTGLRQWIAEQPGHGRLRIGQHALAYCYHALGRTADADRLFRRLGFKLKDILEPKPPAFR